MAIPIRASVRSVALVSIIILLLGILIIRNNSKEKNEYLKTTGTIEFLENSYQNLPVGNNENFRYLKVDTYPYVFEVYAPNSIETPHVIDDLQIGDTVDLYYYEINKTHSLGINKFIQFIDKDQEAYFIRDGFQKSLGYFVIGLSVLLNIFAFVLWKLKKIVW